MTYTLTLEEAVPATIAIRGDEISLEFDPELEVE